jgi:rfaE bifunctional protein nucleotidyltransferase chain/domain
MEATSIAAKTVLVHGVFDVLHAGHISLLEQAAEFGDNLVVSITADRFVNKGPGRPVFMEADRKRVLQALRCVDHVYTCEDESAIPAIEAFKPDAYVKGAEYDTRDTNGYLVAESDAVKQGGGKVYHLTTMPALSSSQALNKTMPTIPEEARQWLHQFQIKGHDFEQVEAAFEAVRGLSALCLGERITDKYVWVEPAGKSPKDSIVTWVHEQPAVETVWAGGIDVIAEAVGSITGTVTPPSMWTNDPVVKTRYVHRPFNQKVFSITEPPDRFRSPMLGFPDHGNSDLLMIADFGHGLFSDTNVRLEIANTFDRVALTVQSNSSNWGMNRITKWKNAWYLASDRAEAELALGRTDLDEDEMALQLGNLLDADYVSLTLGHRGAVLADAGSFLHVPVFAVNAVDRLGAGDAFFSYTAPFLKVGVPLDIVALIGSCAAALHVQQPGNKAVEPRQVLGFIKAIMA